MNLWDNLFYGTDSFFVFFLFFLLDLLEIRQGETLQSDTLPSPHSKWRMVQD